MPVAQFAHLSLVLALLVALGCGKDSSAEAEAAPYGNAECARCGMVLKHQAAPRGQVLHRDGKRAFFCSIDDLVRHIEAPGEHGKPVAVWVETQDPAVDPSKMLTDARPWKRAERAAFVLGVPRKGVMGPPVVAYVDGESARRASKAHPGATHHGWASLQTSIRKARRR